MRSSVKWIKAADPLLDGTTRQQHNQLLLLTHGKPIDIKYFGQEESVQRFLSRLVNYY